MVSFDTPAASASSRSVSTCSIRRVLSLSTFTSISRVVQNLYFMRKLYRQSPYITRLNTDKCCIIGASDKEMAPAVLATPRSPAHEESLMDTTSVAYVLCRIEDDSSLTPVS